MNAETTGAVPAATGATAEATSDAGAVAAAEPGIPVEAVDWRSCIRLIPTRFPTIGLYDRVADPADLEVVFAVEMLTNPRVREELGQLQLVPPAERVTGAGSTLVMAAFTHLNPEGSRFSDGSYGVYYAAHGLETAVAEVGHHRARFLGRTSEPATDVDLRAIVAGVHAELHDLRALPTAQSAVLDPQHYGVSQALGGRLRAAGSAGVIFPSVRHSGGVCIGAFRPKAIRHARPGTTITLHWDGARISHWYEKRGLQHVPAAPL